jgi:glycerol-3-phosphate dehydrogenase
MAEHCVDEAAKLGGLATAPSVTRDLPIHGSHADTAGFGHLSVYGSDATSIVDLAAPQRLHPELPYTEAEVIWAARREMARTVEDVLARRTRALFLNARAAMSMAPRAAELLAGELGRDLAWVEAQVGEFRGLAGRYLPAAL